MTTDQKESKKSPIWLAVDKLNERLDKIEQKLSAPATVNLPPLSLPQSAPVVERFPMPTSFREAVDLILNKNFEIRLDPMPDSPAFLFTIVVPRKYSKLPANQGEDVRSKVITYADGVVGVRLWAEKVYNNLGEDVKKLVIEDRPFANRPIQQQYATS